ncbi:MULTISPECIES: glycosyltransferase [unclassified Spirosoma]|uniref:glycosyltransferase n=1 Tax=unclassified Spirosoma TaxID=2621999 RepID=UPI00095EAB91|nr:MULTISPECIES: glycosyltransferase [unclassified Spirosoma]MBN8826819.1 glycosyltransferase [Spirosoma sp.]OJW73641.1 MAG: glycosyl transferase family 2 [Spirosoma sp. 48-14]
MVITALLIAWLVIVGIQLIYIFFVYSRTALYRQSEPGDVNGQRQFLNESTGGVTVVVCARNELDNLRELLPLLNEQVYPHFEVLVMDDRSTDGTLLFLENDIAHLGRVRFIRIDKEHEHVTPKKYALTIALKKAVYPIVLLTDADCRPASTNWLAGMVTPLVTNQKDITLGFSPYYTQPGLLNLLIRSETLFTAVQYISLALAGSPYMGVGRNLAYRTSLFFANRGFYSHMNVVGGDDDLFVNEVATGKNTAVCLHPDTFTWSAPKETWSEWRQQKRRHLNAGKYYKQRHKLRLGLLLGSHVLSWVLAMAVGLVVLTHELQHRSFTSNEWLFLLTATGIFALRLIAFWGIVGRVSYRLAHTVHWAIMPLMDILLAIYYGLSGLANLFVRRKKRLYWK